MEEDCTDLPTSPKKYCICRVRGLRGRSSPLLPTTGRGRSTLLRATASDGGRPTLLPSTVMQEEVGLPCSLLPQVEVDLTYSLVFQVEVGLAYSLLLQMEADRFNLIPTATSVTLPRSRYTCSIQLQGGEE